ncbi:hypothetical protein HanOQP8_Chr06g0209221 [Helianthus annuus]|nr:hypothetical protein HanHA89_Chr06g0215041 [Helianthus annuus]KAJ0739754.1 hypothetical protein HanOQP8_Chr06g0209221 [Helianthus annuus]
MLQTHTSTFNLKNLKRIDKKHTGAGTRDSSWILNICPSFSAAPRILHRARAKRSAFFSDKNGESAD